MTYKIYLKNETGDEVLDNIRTDYHWEGQDMYVLLNEAGQYTIVQSSNLNPTGEHDIELAAQKHIQMLEDEKEEAKRLEEQERIKTEEEEARKKQLEDTVAKQTELLASMAQLIAQLQANQISQANNTVTE